ncbi:MAG: MFS transporter [Proteobacteria bacterium]|nr:MFS transporter [Pseudomonadota bacterium]
MRKIVPRGLPRGVWVVTIASAVLMSGIGMIVPLIPAYTESLGASAADLGWVMASFFIGRILGQVPAGLVTDRIGRRMVLLGALVGYTVSCLGYATTRDAIWLIPFRFIQGASGGFFSVAARSLMNDLAGPKQRGGAHGVYSASINLGFAVGPMVGSFLAKYIDMSAPFWGSAGLSAIALLVLSFVSFIGRPPPKIVSSIPKGLTEPLRDKRVLVLALTSLFFMAGMSVIHTLFSVAAKAEIEDGILFVGKAVATAGISGFLLGPFAGRLSDRIGRQPIMLAGAILAAAEGLTLLTTRNPWIIGFGFLLGGIGVAAFANGLYAQIGDITTKKSRGMVTGIVGMAGYCGGMAGALLTPRVWEITNLRLPFGFQLIFNFCAVICIVWMWRFNISRQTSPLPFIEPDDPLTRSSYLED